MHVVIASFLSLGIGMTVGMLGGGGSTLTVPMLVYVLGVPAQTAIAASLFVVCVTGVVGALAHVRSRTVSFRACAVFGLGGMAGAFAGGRLARHLSARIALTGFGLLVLVTAIVMIRRRRADDAERAPGSEISVPRSIALGTSVGALSGLLGAGGGVLIVPALEIGGGLALREAIATSPLITAIQCLAGFVGRLGNGELPVRIVAVVTCTSVLGCVVGALVAHHVSTRVLRRGFAWLLLAVSVLVLTKQLP
jgi:uncharacterized protein